MKKLLYPIAFAILLLGCTKTKEAVQYNDFLVASIDTTMVQLLTTEDAIQAKKYKVAAEKFDKLQLVVNQQLEKVKERPPFNNEIALQKATIGWLQYYKEICEDQLSSVIQIVESDSLTENDAARIKELIISSYNKEEEKHSQFIETQKEYAEKYNFELKEGEFFYYNEEGKK